MNLRQALIEQTPSLALQRATQVEIARLDRVLADVMYLLERQPGPERAADIREQLALIVDNYYMN